MDLNRLQQYLHALVESLENDDKVLLNGRLEGLISVFPFNEYEYILMFLLNRGTIQFEAYDTLRREYVLSNRYLGLFELSPRVFGEIWGHQHLMDLDQRLKKPSKGIDPAYGGQYDLQLGDIRVEAKACRAINTKKRGGLVSKALRYDSQEPFWMNFQQLKVGVCDVFVFIGVWVDRIVYWVLSDSEIKSNKYLSHQHRGGIEYQIGITRANIADFKGYEVAAGDLADVVIQKAAQC